MKLFRIFIICISVALITSCSESPDFIGQEQSPVTEDVYYEIVEDEHISFLDLIEELFSQSGPAEDMASFKDQVIRIAQQNNVALRSRLGVEDAECGYRKIVYNYISTDHQGQEITLSSSLLWSGYYIEDVWHDTDPDDICLLEHYTITNDSQSPSESYLFESIAVGNTLVVMPDYIGYGKTAELVHPYLNHALCAENSLDALEAGYCAFDQLHGGSLKDEWRLYVAGVSQGGANALAVHKYMDTHPEYAESWNFAYSNCAAGPYSPIVTINMYYEKGVLTYPVLFPLVFKSYLTCYPDILKDVSEDRFYSDKYLDIKSQVDEMLAGKNHDTSEINSFIKLELKDLFDSSIELSEIRVSDILSEEILDTGSDLYKMVYKCLEANDLTKGWSPVHKIKLYHSSADDVVPYENSLTLQESFGAEMVTLTRDIMNSDHLGSSGMWMLTLMLGGI